MLVVNDFIVIPGLVDLSMAPAVLCVVMSGWLDVVEYFVEAVSVLVDVSKFPTELCVELSSEDGVLECFMEVVSAVVDEFKDFVVVFKGSIVDVCSLPLKIQIDFCVTEDKWYMHFWNLK